jgi:hypothetical protein
MYPDPESALRESPELTRKDLRKTLQVSAGVTDQALY